MHTWVKQKSFGIAVQTNNKTHHIRFELIALRPHRKNSSLHQLIQE